MSDADRFWSDACLVQHRQKGNVVRVVGPELFIAERSSVGRGPGGSGLDSGLS